MLASPKDLQFYCANTFNEHYVLTLSPKQCWTVQSLGGNHWLSVLVCGQWLNNRPGTVQHIFFSMTQVINGPSFILLLMAHDLGEKKMLPGLTAGRTIVLCSAWPAVTRKAFTLISLSLFILFFWWAIPNKDIFVAHQKEEKNQETEIAGTLTGIRTPPTIYLALYKYLLSFK